MGFRTIGLISFLAYGLLVGGSPVTAQQPEKIYRLGLLRWAHFVPLHGGFLPIHAFGQEMRDRGYWIGQNLVQEVRTLKGAAEDRDQKVAELLQLKVDVIAASSSPLLIRAAQQATRTIPIVMQGVTVDPVEAGFVQSLARPGGNITGLTNLESELNSKRLELLKQGFPRISRVLVLWPANQRKREIRQIENMAEALGVQVLSLVRAKPLEQHLEGVFSTISREKPDALLLADVDLAVRYEPRIIEYTTKNGLPTMYGRSRFVESGGLISYGANLPHLFRRSAIYVDKILKGAKPADLPVERPGKFDLVINLKTATAMGLTLPPEMRYRADKVIE